MPQVIMAAIAASDGTRKGVRDAVFEGTGITVAATIAMFGKNVGLDPKTGDIDVRDFSLFQIKDNKENFTKISSLP